MVNDCILSGSDCKQPLLFGGRLIRVRGNGVRRCANLDLRGQGSHSRGVAPLPKPGQLAGHSEPSSHGRSDAFEQSRPERIVLVVSINDSQSNSEHVHCDRIGSLQLPKPCSCPRKITCWRETSKCITGYREEWNSLPIAGCRISDIAGRLFVERLAIQAPWESAKPLQRFKQFLGIERLLHNSSGARQTRNLPA